MRFIAMQDAFREGDGEVVIARGWARSGRDR
jgi:hypothetical protein